MEPAGGGKRVKGGATKEQKGWEHVAPADEAVLRTEEAVLDAPRRSASWEAVNFEVAP